MHVPRSRGATTRRPARIRPTTPPPTLRPLPTLPPLPAAAACVRHAIALPPSGHAPRSAHLLRRRVGLLVFSEVVGDQRAVGAATRDDSARVAGIGDPHRIPAQVPNGAAKSVSLVGGGWLAQPRQLAAWRPRHCYKGRMCLLRNNRRTRASAQPPPSCLRDTTANESVKRLRFPGTISANSGSGSILTSPPHSN